MSRKANKQQRDRELAALLKAAERANWDAQHGPLHLRSGRFRPLREGAETADSSSSPPRQRLSSHPHPHLHHRGH
ncbi:MAG: hypothetical protein GKR94_07335 [Gammaproteobacteria bacterium]|nr:hypothetical protein [Gammaproteobacteria bacterium]